MQPSRGFNHGFYIFFQIALIQVHSKSLNLKNSKYQIPSSQILLIGLLSTNVFEKLAHSKTKQKGQKAIHLKCIFFKKIILQNQIFPLIPVSKLKKIQARLKSIPIHQQREQGWGARAPPEFGGSGKGQSLISVYQSLAITMSTSGFKKLYIRLCRG